jgi:predicted phage terminase large subunit-like protein
MQLPTIQKILNERARRSFHDFVPVVSPKYIEGWFNADVRRRLDVFRCKVALKQSPNLMIVAPPRHGKSELSSRKFPAYCFGKHPTWGIIGCSYSQDLASRMNRDVQRTIDSDEYKGVFPGTKLNEGNVRTVGNWMRNSDLFEIVEHGGSYRAAGVGVGITGMGCHILNIDDPVKDAKAASSATLQEAIYEWYTSTALTRLEDGGGQILTMTRWNVNDLAGKILQNADEGEWEVVCYPAIALQDEEHRRIGEALFPERYSTEKLEKLRRRLGTYYFEALYQGGPTDRKGKFFEWENLEIVPTCPAHVKQWVRYWDKAGTKDGGAYTAGVLIGKGSDGRWYIKDVVRGQWAAPKREAVIKQTAETDGRGVTIWIEQEPGSGGKESAEATKRNLAGWTVYSENPTGDKVTRAEPYAVQVEVGQIRLVAGAWNHDFIEEHKTFPNGYKDQIDSAAGGFNKLCGDTEAGVF